MLRMLFSTACVALLTLTLRADDKLTKQVPPAIVGHWAVTEAHAGGKKVELRQDMVFKPNGTMNLIDRTTGKQSLFRYELDTKSRPHRVALTYLGPEEKMRNLRQLGIWKFEKESLTLLLGPPKSAEQSKEDTYPAGFAKPGETEFLLNFEKMVLE